MTTSRGEGCVSEEGLLAHHRSRRTFAEGPRDERALGVPVGDPDELRLPDLGLAPGHSRRTCAYTSFSRLSATRSIWPQQMFNGCWPRVGRLSGEQSNSASAASTVVVRARKPPRPETRRAGGEPRVGTLPKLPGHCGDHRLSADPAGAAEDLCHRGPGRHAARTVASLTPAPVGLWCVANVRCACRCCSVFSAF